MKTRGLLFIFISLLLSVQSLAQEDLRYGILYLFPGPGAKYVHPASTIIVRFSNISPEDITNLESLIVVLGDESGAHSGETLVASD